ncbi:MAG: hypothetical protein ACFFDX_00580 [Candidatus Odinarchaeota archaeon]
MINKKILKEINKLKRDNKSGANEFIDKTLKIIISQLKYVEDQNEDITVPILELSRKIFSSRPSMAPLINTIGFLIHDLEIINKKSLLLKIHQLEKEREKLTSNLALNFLSFLKNFQKEPLKLMLLSYSSTITDLLNNYEKNNLIIYILESRPLFEGYRVAELLSKSYETHLIIDAAMGKFIDRIDFVFIGVDSVLEDGSIINKIGTYPLAVLTKSINAQVYAICDSFKYNLLSHYGYEVKIEEKPIKEVYNKKKKQKLLKVHNYYFDITPPQYIDGVISDLGILPVKKFIEKVKDKLPIDWFESFIKV